MHRASVNSAAAGGGDKNMTCDPEGVFNQAFYGLTGKSGFVLPGRDQDHGGHQMANVTLHKFTC